jgi:hypothetical protein
VARADGISIFGPMLAADRHERDRMIQTCSARAGYRCWSSALSVIPDRQSGRGREILLSGEQQLVAVKSV